MRNIINMLMYDIRRRSRDSFLIGYNIIFPIIMVALLGYLSSKSYGSGFTGYQYYSIVMLPFCISMAVITAAYAGKEDAYKRTAVRFLYAPVSGAHIILTKLISCTIVLSACNLLVLLFSMLVFRLPIADNIILLTLLLTSEAFAVCALGLLIGLGMKNFIFIKNIINIPICVAAVLGGAFFPMGSFNPVWKTVIRISPLTWINRSIFLYIYDSNSELLAKTGLLLILTGIIFTILAIRLFRKEEFIHGDLPGFEK
jgi:ABC-2 type transport system permease protein